MQGVSFREVDPTRDAAKILAWRTSSFVDDQMLTRVNHDLRTQQEWLQRVRCDGNYYHWIIQVAHEDVGLINVGSIDRLSRECSWGFYLSNASHTGVGAFIPPYVYNWMFRTLSIDRVHARVLSSNSAALRIHKFYGMVESDDASELDEKGSRLRTLYLDRCSWDQSNRYHAMYADFPVRKWNARGSLFTP